jgi:hypothetical protein
MRPGYLKPKKFYAGYGELLATWAKLALLYICFIPLSGLTQYHITKYDNSQGLTFDDYTYAVAQDSAGTIWIVNQNGFKKISGQNIEMYPVRGKTRTMGVVSFDGYQFNFQGGHFLDGIFSYDSTYGTYGTNTYIRSGGLKYKGETFLQNRQEMLIGLNTAELQLYTNKDQEFEYLYNHAGDRIYLDSIPFLVSNKEFIKDLDYIKNKNPNLDYLFKNVTEANAYYSCYDFILMADLYCFMRDSGLVLINKQLDVNVIRPTEFRYIESIVESGKDTYLVLTEENNQLLRINRSGKIVKSYDVLEGCKASECYLKSLHNDQYLVTRNSIYLITDEPERIVSAPGFFSPIILDKNHILYTIRHKNKYVFYEYKNGKINRLGDLMQKPGEKYLPHISGAFKDKESNLWIIANSCLYKLSPIPSDYQYINEFNDWQNGLPLTQSIHFIGDYIIHFNNNDLLKPGNGTNTHLYFIKNHELDSINTNGVHVFKQYVGKDTILFEERLVNESTGDSTYKLGVITANEELKIEYIDSSGHGEYSTTQNYVLKQHVGLYKRIGTKLKLMFPSPVCDRLHDVQNDSGYVVFSTDSIYPDGTLTRQFSLTDRNGKTKKDLFTGSGSIHTGAFFLDNEQISYFDNDSLYHVNIETGIRHVSWIEPTFRPKLNQDAYKVADGNFIYVSLLGELVLFSSYEERFYLLLQTGLSLPAYIETLFYDPETKKISLVADHRFYQIDPGQTPWSLDLMSDAPFQFFNISSFRESDYDIYLALDHRVFHYNKNFTVPFDSLYTSVIEIIVHKTNNSVIAFDPGNFNNDLDYDLHTISFKAETKTNYFPETVRYHYQLEGSKMEEWQTTYSDSIAFSNLEPNDYTLRLKAENGFGIYSSELILHFTVHPPWWATSWFSLLQAVFFGSLLIITYFFSRQGASTTSTVLTMITIIVIFEALLTFVSGYIDVLSHGIPVIRFIANVILALCLKPLDRMVENFFNRKSERK